MPGKLSMCFVIWMLCAQVPDGHAQTVLDGLYSETQAARGEAAYKATCSVCHGSGLDGVSAPALTGERFIEHWREGPLSSFYNFIRERMPPMRSAPVSGVNYLDIVTYILKVNGYPAGARELVSDHLEDVMFVGKNGPQPVPDGSLILTAGCLAQTGEDRWILTNATEPVRAEFKGSSQKNLGSLSFRLTDFEAVPGFEPATNKGHKVQVQGYLVRQPNAERISLTSIELAANDTNCAN
jgi:mono/diheme cytochrome c family protein